MPQDAAKMTFTLHYTKKNAEFQYIFFKKFTFNIKKTIFEPKEPKFLPREFFKEMTQQEKYSSSISSAFLAFGVVVTVVACTKWKREKKE